MPLYHNAPDVDKPSIPPHGTVVRQFDDEGHDVLVYSPKLKLRSSGLVRIPNTVLSAKVDMHVKLGTDPVTAYHKVLGNV